MRMGTCVRCGKNGEVDYGQDGLAYCSECAFYGLNKQCNKCRMYLPAMELQQYRGQLLCPYCIQDMREEVRKEEAPAERGNLPAYSPDLPILHETEVQQVCDRCGCESEKFYLWNGKRLCKKCLEDGQKTWHIEEGAPPPQSSGAYVRKPVSTSPQKQPQRGAVSNILGALGLGKKQKPPSSAIDEPRTAQAHPPRERIPNIDLARPMTESPQDEQKNDQQKPEEQIPIIPQIHEPHTEGLISLDRSRVVSPTTLNPPSSRIPSKKISSKEQAEKEARAKAIREIMKRQKPTKSDSKRPKK